jgi:phospholipid/cholesterol/gamma-HCH transport system substrate-binding protein
MSATKKSTAVLAGVGLVVFFIGAVYIALTASTGLPGQSHRIVKAEFPSVGGLRVGDDVRKASVRVGQVTGIALGSDDAVVTLQLGKNEPVYRDATVSVESRSALGQNFVALDAGSPKSGSLPKNGKIPVANATGPASLDEVLSTFDPKTRAALASSLRQVGGGLAGHGDDLHSLVLNSPDLLRDLGTVSRSLSSQDADLAGLLSSTRTLAGRFDGRQQQLADLTRNLDKTFGALAVDGGKPISQTLKSAPGTLQHTRAAMDALQQPLTDLHQSMKALSGGARALGAATPDLRGALSEAVAPLGKVPGVSRQALPAVDSLTKLLRDARPLAPKVATLLDSTHQPSAALGPYASEISRFFTYWVSANRFFDKSGHYLRIDLVIRPESITGVVPIRDPLVHRDPYPAPGQASNDRATTLLGGN